MVPVRLLVVFLLTAVFLTAGCLGGDGDEVAPDDDDGTARPTAETGSVTGSILTIDLEPIQNAQLSLVDPSNELAASASSKQDGSFVINGVAPGTYRLQVSAVCCRGAAEFVNVIANEQTTQSFQLEPFSDLDLKIPYGYHDEYVGFMACMVTTPTDFSTGCGPVAAGNDPNIGIGTGPGIRTFVAALQWDGAEELTFEIIHSNTEHLYKTITGPSPLELRIDNDEIEEENVRFDQFDEDGTLLQLEARPAMSTAIYQKDIKFYWYIHYWETGPPVVQVLPDA